MEAFSCRKCGQVVEAQKMPHSCPRCYSPAVEAYAVEEGRGHVVDSKFDAGGGFEGAPGWEQSLTTVEISLSASPEVRRGSDPEILEVLDVDAIDVDGSDPDLSRHVVDEGMADALKVIPPPLPPATSASQDIPPLSRAPAPPPRSSVAPPPRSSVAPPPRSSVATLPRSAGISASESPPRPSSPPLGAARSSRPRRTRRIPTASVARVTDAIDGRRRRRVLVVLWSGGLLIVGLAAFRIFAYPEVEKTLDLHPPVAVVATVADAGRRSDDLRVTYGATGRDIGRVLSDGGSRASWAIADGVATSPSSRSMSAPHLLGGGRRPPSREPRAPAVRSGGLRARAVATAVSRAPERPSGRHGTGVASRRRSSGDLTKPRGTRGAAVGDSARQQQGGAPSAPTPTRPPPTVDVPTKRVPAVQAGLTAARGLYRLGVQKLLLGQPTDALRLFQRALKLRPSFALAYRGMGLAYQKIGNGAKARAAFLRYLAASPKASDAAAIRGRLRTIK